MDATRRTAIATGTLLILATLASLSATALLPELTGADYLTGVSQHSSQLSAAALLYLVAAAASVGIAVALYPLLKQTNATLALGSAVFRTIEAVFYTAGVVSLLTIGTLAQQLATAPAGDRAPTSSMADTLVSIREHSSVAAVFAFSVGAFMYYLVFYRSRLVPRWLSGWGLAAALSLMTACLLALFNDTPVTGYVLLALPIGVQEMVLAVWLLVRGFSLPPPSPRTSRASSALSPDITTGGPTGPGGAH